MPDRFSSRTRRPSNRRPNSSRLRVDSASLSRPAVASRLHGGEPFLRQAQVHGRRIFHDPGLCPHSGEKVLLLGPVMREQSGTHLGQQRGTVRGVRPELLEQLLEQPVVVDDRRDRIHGRHPFRGTYLRNRSNTRGMPDHTDGFLRIDLRPNG